MMLRSMDGPGVELTLRPQDVSYLPFLSADGGSDDAAEQTEDALDILVSAAPLGAGCDFVSCNDRIRSILWLSG